MFTNADNALGISTWLQPMVTCDGKSFSGRAEDAMHDSHKELS
jgi:hypothetical protein